MGGGGCEEGAEALVDGRGGELVALPLRRDAGDGGAWAAAVGDEGGPELEGGGEGDGRGEEGGGRVGVGEGVEAEVGDFEVADEGGGGAAGAEGEEVVVVVVDGVEEGEEGEEGRGQGGAEEVDANDEAEDREEEDGAGEGDGEDGVRGGRGGGGVGVVAEGHGRGQWLVDSVLVFLDGLVSKWTSEKSHLGRTWSDSWI